MAAQTNTSKSIWVLIPIFGSLLFIILYIIAALLYPGGSETDKTAIGYSWTNNYWCNLLNEKAINGQTNTARPVAVTAMLIICLSLSFFWILFPTLTRLKKYQRLLIQVAGTVCMVTSLLLLTGVGHDLAVNTSSAFGLIAMLGTLVGLHYLKLKGLFVFGLFNLLLVALNNYLYHSNRMTYLPVVQTFSFLSFLVWLCLIDFKLYQRFVRTAKNSTPDGG